MLRGVVINNSEVIFTKLSDVFTLINNSQNKYNWLISSYECYPMKEKYLSLLSKKYCWMRGEELTEMIEYEDFQWIWGVFSAFPKEIKEEHVISAKLPQADGYKGIWEKPISMQHPFSEIEIIAWDSSMTIIISRNDELIEQIKRKNPLSEELEEYIS